MNTLNIHTKHHPSPQSLVDWEMVNISDIRTSISALGLLDIPSSDTQELKKIDQEIYQEEREIWESDNETELASESAYSADLQTQKYRPLSASDEPVLNLWLNDAEQQLQEVHQEVKEARELDSEIDLVPSSAYPVLNLWLNDAEQQLQEVHQEVKEARELDSEIDLVPSSAYDDAYWLLKTLFGYDVSMPDIGWLIDGGIGFEWWSRDGKGIGTISIYGDNKVVYGASGEVSSGSIETKGTCPLSNFASLNDFRTKLLILCSQ